MRLWGILRLGIVLGWRGWVYLVRWREGGGILDGGMRLCEGMLGWWV